MIQMVTKVTMCAPCAGVKIIQKHPQISKEMKIEEKLIDHSKFISEFESRYLNTSIDYYKSLSAKYGQNPTQKQQDELAVMHNKIADIQNLLNSAKHVNAQLAAVIMRIQQLNDVMTSKRIMVNGEIKETLFAEQRVPFQNSLNKIINFLE